MLGMLRLMPVPRPVALARASCLPMPTWCRKAASTRCIHWEAAVGFSGETPSVYERSRPGYPTEAIRAIEAVILRCRDGGIGAKGSEKKDRSDALVDLGCGTGKFTRQILPFAEKHGFPMVGIEPVESMQDQFKLVLPGVTVMEGTGESLPMPDASAQAVIAAQSFHWMASVATLREVHRVLAPGGPFILVWNILDKTKPWIRAHEEIISPLYEGGVPYHKTGRWKLLFDDVEGSGSSGEEPRLLGNLTETFFQYSQRMTLDELESRTRSISVVSSKPESAQVDIIRRIQELAGTHPDTQDDLARDNKVELVYNTEVYWCHKRL